MTNIKNRAILLTACALLATSLTAQTVKPITISSQDSYTDHITLKNDATDKDLMVKFDFNQADNTVTVTLISYRMLYVFWDDTRYNSAISGHKIHPDKLSYVANSNPKDRFHLTKDFCNSLPKPYKKYVFKKWFGYDGLQPIDQELQMVNDFIQQKFNVQGKRDMVIIRLRDIMLMDLVKQKGESREYEISYGKNLDTDYRITIQRDPCFGLDEELTASQGALDAVTKSYTAMKKRYGKGTVTSDDALKAFQELQATMMTQYLPNEEESPCPEIQQNRQQYNQLVDSIAQIEVQVAAEDAGMSMMGAKGRAMNNKTILANARQIDKLVSRWLMSKDPIERSDLAKQCQNIIKDTQTITSGRAGSTEEERNAINIFRKAENYFNKTCK
jgi:hypothetical protein